jgi:hypothetical protein
MIAMQYSIALPADYDMDIIDRRIRDKGPALDHFPHLRFKAYLTARKQDGGLASAENLYAPFYLWDEPDGLNDFLCGPGFAVLSGDFGWPVVRTWSVWHAGLGADLRATKFATRRETPIKPHADLAVLRRQAEAEAREAADRGALAAVAAFDPTAWAMVQFRLWQTLPKTEDGVQAYSAGYVALP